MPTPRPGRSRRRPAWPRGRSTVTSLTRRPCSSRPCSSRTPPSSRGSASCPTRAGEGTVEGNLVEAAVQLAGLRDQILPLELAIAVDPELAAQRRKAMAAAGTSLPPGPPEAVAAYIAAEQRLGRVREDIDPGEAGRVLLGVLFALGTMPAIGDERLSPDRVASAVRLIVRGLQPTEPERHR